MLFFVLYVFVLGDFWFAVLKFYADGLSLDVDIFALSYTLVCFVLCARVYVCVRVCERGSVIAKIVGRNVIEHSIFVQHVPVWVKEELFNGKKLTEIINTRHENIKYLPGCIIPYNVVIIIKIISCVCFFVSH